MEKNWPMIQGTLFERVIEPSDIVYTPHEVAKNIIKFLQPKGACLDPCKGDGAFYNYLPANSDYCELGEGKDFFNYSKRCDWIIGNPPYSIFFEFLQHSFELADNISFLVPTNKIFQRQIIMDAISKWGGGKKHISVWLRFIDRLPFRVQCWEFSF